MLGTFVAFGIVCFLYNLGVLAYIDFLLQRKDVHVILGSFSGSDASRVLCAVSNRLYYVSTHSSMLIVSNII